MEKLESLPYHKIRKETRESVENHADLIGRITLERWRLEDEADFIIETGRALSPRATQECLEVRKNLYILKGFDVYLEKELSKYISKALNLALLN